MGFGDTSRQICTCLWDTASPSVRRLALQTGLSQSSGPRLTQARERRNRPPASWVWETADGWPWLPRLVVATRYPFGRKRGVGVDTMSAFCARLPLEMQGGGAPSAWRGVRQAVEPVLLATAAAGAPAGRARGEGRAILGAVDAPFWERLLLVCRALSTG